VVEPRFRKDREDAADRYRRYAGTGLASSDLQEVVLAAYHGRVSTLFVACNTHQWGTFDPQTQAIQVVQDAALAQEDLQASWRLTVPRVVRPLPLIRFATGGL
jgi:hypothetical protein